MWQLAIEVRVVRIPCICVFAALSTKLFEWNAAASLPTLERGQAIRGHYRAGGDELVIHARPCLALLGVYLETLTHVRYLRILGAP